MRQIINFFKTHTHHWGIPHKRDGKMVQVCYGCSQQRLITINFSPVPESVEQKAVKALYD